MLNLQRKFVEIRRRLCSSKPNQHVCRQTLVDGAKYVEINGEKYPVRETSRRRPKQLDFRFEDHELRGLEQNPDTKSRWAAMAREGKKVMQFLDDGRYVAVVVEGKMKTYG